MGDLIMVEVLMMVIVSAGLFYKMAREWVLNNYQ